MRQAARSCKQNIVEGVSDSTVSAEMCIKPIGVATDERTLRTRTYCINNDDPRDFVSKCSERSNETVANIMLTQIRQIDSMLAKLLKKLETEFIAQG